MAAPEWSESENSRFESALATHGNAVPGCWDRIAAAVGGSRTAEDVRRHYDQLVVDIHNIEATGGGAGVGRTNTNRGGAAGTSNGGENNGRRPQR